MLWSFEPDIGSNSLIWTQFVSRSRDFSRSRAFSWPRAFDLDL